MTGNNIALDTNQAIAVLNGRITRTQLAARAAGFWLPVPVVGELIYGALNSTRHADNHAKVLDLISRCRILDATTRTAEAYAQVRVSLKKLGRPLPENDIWIAAICLEADLPLATDDAHFQHVPNLQTLSL